MKKPYHRTIEQCQTPDLPYIQWHMDAERRMVAGQVQEYCTVCERYKWLDKACADAQLVADRTRGRCGEFEAKEGSE